MTSVRAPRSSGWLLTVAGLAGLAAAFTLTVERFETLVDPSYRPSCSLNPVLSCGSVMVTPQAAVFGFPNPLIGIVSFTVVTLSGVLALARVGLPRWYWFGLAAGAAAGTGFVCWLVVQSLYRIGALCPYCMVVWAIVLPILAVAVRLAFGGVGGPIGVLIEWRWTLVALAYAVLLVLVFERFQDYWTSLL